MKQITGIKKVLKNISPFNNLEEMSGVEFVIKKLLAFLLIYAVSMILAEVIVIGVHYVMGYDVLNGEMMDFTMMSLMKYYGYFVFLIIGILYCIMVEKRSLKSMGFNGKILEYFAGAFLAVVLVGFSIGAITITGNLSYAGIIENRNTLLIMAFLGGFIIQGAMEEVLCRGFLLLSLARKLPIAVAIGISASVFAIPHFPALFWGNILYDLIGNINLYLVSIIFSMLLLRRKNIWVVCGMHSIWNFLLYNIFGLNLSGNKSSQEAVFSFETGKENICNGGPYGIEASLITVLVLGITAIILCKGYIASKKEGENYGIS